MYKVIGMYIDYGSYGIHSVSDICETLEVAEKLATEMREERENKKPVYTEVSIYEAKFVNGILKAGRRL